MEYNTDRMIIPKSGKVFVVCYMSVTAVGTGETAEARRKPDCHGACILLGRGEEGTINI